jgi:hypothetical protein
MNPLELYEAYSAVYAPQEVDEEQLDEDAGIVSGLAGLALGAKGARYAAKHTKRLRDYPKNFVKGMIDPRTYVPKKKKEQNEEYVDVFDVVLEFLYVEGYAETLEEAEWMMANIIDEEAIAIVLGEEELDEADSLAAMQARREKRQKANMKKHGTPGFDYSKPPSGKKGYLDAITKKEEYVDEAITSEKGKAKAAEMIAARSTPSGRAKSGQGANVAQIKHIGRANVDGKFNTPPNEKVAKNPVKSTAYLRGSGNKAARRAGTYKEEFELWVNELVEEGYDLSDYTWDDMFDIYEDSRRMSNKQHAERVRRNISSFGKSKSVEYTPPKNWDPEANRGQGAVLSHKQVEKQRRKSLRQEEYVDESQYARENPEKYEREQAKKSAPVRGERTPMPPRGDKRREDFEKWYAKNVR